MKIDVALNSKSIKDTIKRLQKIKAQIPTMQKEFVQEVAHWITNKANEYIDLADLGSNVKEAIKTGWDYEPTSNGIKVINHAQKESAKYGTVPLAILVEFGVGIVGGGEPHPNAIQEGYDYNKDNGKKDEYGYWHFYSDQQDLDIPRSAISWGANGRGKNNRMSIYTRGTKGVMYAYNAIVDARMDLQNPNGKLATIWKQIEERYIK